MPSIQGGVAYGAAMSAATATDSAVNHTELGDLEHRLAASAKSLSVALAQLRQISDRIIGSQPEAVSTKDGPPVSRHCSLACLSQVAADIDTLAILFNREVERMLNL